MTNYSAITAQPEYDIAFWDMLRNNGIKDSVLSKGIVVSSGTYEMPTDASAKLMKALKKESLFRQISSVYEAYRGDFKIYAKDYKENAQFVSEGGAIPIYDGLEDFTSINISSYKAAAIVKLDEDFVSDAGFDIEKYLIGKFAKSFGRVEDNAFINGTGNNEPTGILNVTGGADVGISSSALSYDDVISLYFTVPSEYRKNGVWLMNDKTALTLRKLKDSDGNYLWNSNTDTILGKPVQISEFMPDAGKGTKPIAFGDFSYYWVVGRRPVSVRTLTEKFTLYDQVGYLGIEFLDGKLVRKDAIKLLEIK